MAEQQAGADAAADTTLRDPASFEKAYRDFCAASGRVYSPNQKIRTITVPTHGLWLCIQDHGGFNKVVSGKLWATVSRTFDAPKSWTNSSHFFKKCYEESGLLELEQRLGPDGPKGPVAPAAPRAPKPRAASKPKAERAGSKEPDGGSAAQGGPGPLGTPAITQQHRKPAPKPPMPAATLLATTLLGPPAAQQQQQPPLPQTPQQPHALSAVQQFLALQPDERLAHQLQALKQQQQAQQQQQQQQAQQQQHAQQQVQAQVQARAQQAPQASAQVSAAQPPRLPHLQGSVRERQPSAPAAGAVAGAPAPSGSQQQSKQPQQAQQQGQQWPVPSPVQQQRPALAGQGVVDQRIRVWWPVDRRWYTGSVKMYDALSGRHTVHYEDGDTETLDLAAETWEVVGGAKRTAEEQLPGQAHKMQATTGADNQGPIPAATAAGTQDTHKPSNQGAAAAQGAAALRVVLDGSAVRVVSPQKAPAAATAEISLPSIAAPAAGGPAGAGDASKMTATAGAAAAQQQQQQQALSPQDRHLLPSRPSSPLLGSGSMTESALGAVLLGTPQGMADAGLLLGTEPTPPPPMLMTREAAVGASPGGVTGDGGAAAGQLRQRLVGFAGDVRPQQQQQHGGEEGGEADDENGMALGGAGEGGALPNSVLVQCGDNKGSFLLRSREIACLCSNCAKDQASTGRMVTFNPVEFERHSGMGLSRKWKNSIKVQQQGGGHVNLGTWLQRMGLEQPRIDTRGPPISGAPPPAAAGGGLQYGHAQGPFMGSGNGNGAGGTAAFGRSNSSGGSGSLGRGGSGSMGGLAGAVDGRRAGQQGMGSRDAALPAAGALPQQWPQAPHSSEAHQQQQQQLLLGRSAGANGSAAGGGAWQQGQGQQQGPAGVEAVQGLRGEGYQVLRADDPPGYEVLCLMPGFMIDEVNIKAWDDGRMHIRAQPKDPRAGALWGLKPIERLIQLPRSINAASAQALMTLHGQLFVRVNDE